MSLRKLESILGLSPIPQFEKPEYKTSKFVDKDGFTYYWMQGAKWYHFKFHNIRAFINSDRNYGVINVSTDENPAKFEVGCLSKKLYVSGSIDQISDTFNKN